MIKLKLLLVASTLIISSAAFAHSDTKHSHESREQVAWHQIEEGALIIDSRTAKEYALGHIEGAINIPFDVSVSQFKALEIRKDRKVVLYCRSGNRSGKALASLKEAGYTNLHNGGGFKGLMAKKK